jgi:type VI secretion system lysozyme-like protein
MTDPGLHSRVPLLDRLVDEAPWEDREVPPRRTLDRRSLRESVRRELERLFNTRSPLSPSRLTAMAARDRTVADYGIPDLAGFAPANRDHWGDLAHLLTRTVAAYEPRLVDPRVEVRQDPEEDEALVVYVDGALQIEGVLEPITFPVVFRGGRGEVSYYERA